MNLFPEWRDTSQILAPVNHFPATNDHLKMHKNQLTNVAEPGG